MAEYLKVCTAFPAWLAEILMKLFLTGVLAYSSANVAGRSPWQQHASSPRQAKVLQPSAGLRQARRGPSSPMARSPEQ